MRSSASAPDTCARPTSAGAYDCAAPLTCTGSRLGSPRALEPCACRRCVCHHIHKSAAAIRAQIAELNAKVVAYCVPIVTSNVKQYLHYRKDVSTLPEPMAYGLATSQAGSRSLEMKPFV